MEEGGGVRKWREGVESEDAGVSCDNWCRLGGLHNFSTSDVTTSLFTGVMMVDNYGERVCGTWYSRCIK